MQITAAVTRDTTSPPVLEPISLDEPRADELVVRIVAAGICHTDLTAPQFVPLPLVLGHEGAGIVEVAGAEAHGFSPGDRVALTFGSCGGCSACHEGAPAYCEHVITLQFGGVRLDGTTTMRQDQASVHGAFFQQSSFATHALVTVRNAVHVPEDIPLKVAAPFGCGIQTGAGAVLNTLRPGAGDSLVIFGVGSVGLAAVMAARLSGCRPLIAVDPNPQRRELAMELGATAAIDPFAEDDLVARVRELTRGGAHASIETAGTISSFTSAVDVLRMRGTCALVTVPNMGKPIEFSPMNLLFGRKLVGVLEGGSVPEVFLPRLFDLYRSGHLPVDRLITEYAFADIATALQDAAQGRAIKPVLNMT